MCLLHSLQLFISQFKEWIGFFENLPDTNFLTFGISISALLILIVFQEVLEPKLKKKLPELKMPVPIDLLIVSLIISSKN